jgi:hypothetical protein
MSSNRKPSSDHARVRLRAVIEANRLSRLSRTVQDEKLTTFKQDQKKAHGVHKEWLDILITIIEEKQAKQEEAEANNLGADYNEGYANGGGGSGTDSG